MAPVGSRRVCLARVYYERRNTLKRRFVLASLAILVLAIGPACGGAAPTATPRLQETKEAVVPATAQHALQEQITAGMQAYDQFCVRCHGPNLTDGSAAKLSKAALAKYATAQGLFDYVAATMPKGNPGGLSEQEYYDIISYLLFKQELLEPGQAVDENTAGDVLLSQ